MFAPLDLKNKTFTKGFRGYETEEVDKFLRRWLRILNAFTRTTLS